MIIDLTVKVKQEIWHKISGSGKVPTFGHIGTHFDVMDKEFPLEYLKTNGKIIDLQGIGDRDIASEDLGPAEIGEQDFVIFHTGFLAAKQYGTAAYFDHHPQLSMNLVRRLLDNKVSMIGIDAPGIRRGQEHTETDQYCADHGVFVVENLANLATLVREAGKRPFVVYTFPISMEGISGLPCRVVAEL